MRKRKPIVPLVLVAGDGEEMVVLAKFTHEFEAEASRALLESGGIPAMVQHGEGVMAGMGVTSALWVSKENLEAARRLLAEESFRLELTPEEEAEDQHEIRKEKVARGARYLLVVAVAYLIFGTLRSLAIVGEIDRLLSATAGHSDTEHVASDLTVRELRELAPVAKVAGFVLVAAVSGAFLGLYFWARKSPVPALIAGAALFGVIQVVSVVTLGSTFFGHSTQLRLGNLTWTVFFLAIWIVAIREARQGGGTTEQDRP